MNTIKTYTRPGLLGSQTFKSALDNFFTDFPRHLDDSTQGYPVTDIYRDDDGSTVLEFALAGFQREELKIDVQPGKRSITVSASPEEDNTHRSRIARRKFARTYVNYDDNLDLNKSTASFENGLLSITVPPRQEMQPISVEIS